jgi:hypothetical protein
MRTRTGIEVSFEIQGDERIKWRLRDNGLKLAESKQSFVDVADAAEDLEAIAIALDEWRRETIIVEQGIPN